MSVPSPTASLDPSLVTIQVNEVAFVVVSGIPQYLGTIILLFSLPTLLFGELVASTASFIELT